MNYAKPEITALASASFVIRNTSGKDEGGMDNEPSDFQTIPAYEADE